MRLDEVLRGLRRHWKLQALIVLAAVAAALVATNLVTPRYTSTAQLFVATSNANDSAELYQGGAFGQQRVKSYERIVTSPVVLGPVAEDPELDTSVEALQDRVSAEVPVDTVLIDVRVDDASADRAQEIAAAVSESYAAAIEELETVNDRSPVRVAVVRPASLPTAPSSPNLPLNLAAAAVAALLLGSALALLRTRLDRRIRTKDDVAALSALPVLATIGRESKTPDPDFAAENPFLPWGEAFRHLRTGLQFVTLGKPAKTVLVTSSIPSEGKTTVAANLAGTLSTGDARVLLIEADLRLPTVSAALGCDTSVGLTDVLIGRLSLKDAVQHHQVQRGGYDVLTSGVIPPNPSELLSSQALRELLDEAGERYDHVVLDAPPVIPVTDSVLLAASVDGVLVVVGSGDVASPQLFQTLEKLEQARGRVLGFVLNLVGRGEPDSGRYASYSQRSAPREKADSRKASANGRHQRT